MASRKIMDSKEQASDLQEKNLIERIELSINYFFDLPTDSVKLQEHVSKIKDAFQLELKANNTKGDEESYLLLQNIISCPEEYLEPLENIKAEVTIGEVQTHIIKLATHFIKNAATEVKQTLASLKWDEPNILAALKIKIGEKFNQPFKTQRRIIPTIQIEPLASPDIYQVTLEEKLQQLQLESTITIDLGRGPFIIRYTYELESIDELKETIRQAFTDGENIAIKKALTHLKILEASPSIKKLVIHSYYFNLFKTNPTIVNEVRNISSVETETLLWPSVVNLLKLNKCDIAIAKNITKAEVRVFECSFYYQKIISNELNVHDFLGITSRKSKNITSPNITQLIQLKKITLEKAKKISTSYRTLLQCEYYFKRILTNDLKFRKLRRISSEQSITLTTPIIIYLIETKKTTFKFVLSHSFSTQCQELLKDPLFLNFVQCGMINLDGILALNSEECGLLISDPLRKALAEKTLPLASALMLIRNPLMMYFIQENLLGYKEISYILPNPTEQAFPLAFNKKYDYDHLRSLIREFIELAKDGLVIEEDLIFLYCYLEDIRMPVKPADAKEEKPTLLANPLLDNPQIRNICLINLQNRLNNILRQTPQSLHNNEIDTLDRLENALMKLLPLPTNLWAEFFGVKLLDVYHTNLNGMQDVQKKMEKVKSMLIISFSQFKEKVFMHFLHSLNYYFTHINPPQSIRVGSLASTLASIHRETSLQENNVVRLPGPPPWQTALNKVIQFSNQGLSFHVETTTTQNESATKKWKPSLTLFPAISESMQAYKNIAMLCEMLDQLDKPSDLLAFESKDSSSLKRKAPRLLA